jgi:hypothetical protein
MHPLTSNNPHRASNWLRVMGPDLCFQENPGPDKEKIQLELTKIAQGGNLAESIVY